MTGVFEGHYGVKDWHRPWEELRAEAETRLTEYLANRRLRPTTPFTVGVRPDGKVHVRVGVGPALTRKQKAAARKAEADAAFAEDAEFLFTHGEYPVRAAQRLGMSLHGMVSRLRDVGLVEFARAAEAETRARQETAA